MPYFKYLGLTLGSTLNYSKHIASVLKLNFYKMTLLAKLKKYLNGDSALLIYKTMLLPYFDYADVIICKAIDKIQTLQNKCLRICTGYSGFLLLSCCVIDRSDLQNLQNYILHVCYRSRLTDMVRIVGIFGTANAETVTMVT